MDLLSFDNDPVLCAMNDPNQRWGDILVERQPTSVDSPLPDLKLRKDIWTHFPVNVYPLGTASDGAERHSIVWRRKELVAWREANPGEYDVWMKREFQLETRLINALKASSKWIVENPEQADQLCIIRMNYKGRQEIKNAEFTVSRIPNLTRLNDIKAYYPVVWHPESPRIYSIELYEKQIKSVASLLRCDPADLSDRVGAQLMKALRASTAWRVLAPVGTEFVRIELTQ
jgi:hypothetical protein